MERIRSLEGLLKYAREVGPKKIAVALAEDAVHNAAFDLFSAVHL